jgi:hypothetical protein
MQQAAGCGFMAVKDIPGEEYRISAYMAVFIIAPLQPRGRRYSLNGQMLLAGG